MKAALTVKAVQAAILGCVFGSVTMVAMYSAHLIKITESDVDGTVIMDVVRPLQMRVRRIEGPRLKGVHECAVFNSGPAETRKIDLLCDGSLYRLEALVFNE